MRARAVLAATIFAGVGAIAEARAEVDYPRAAAVYAQAERELAAGKYDDAARDYGEAYDITKDPIVFYKIGLANEKAGRCDAAVAYYGRYLKEAKPSAQFVAQTQARIAACRAGGAAGGGASTGSGAGSGAAGTGNSTGSGSTTPPSNAGSPANPTSPANRATPANPGTASGPASPTNVATPSAPSTLSNTANAANAANPSNTANPSNPGTASNPGSRVSNAGSADPGAADASSPDAGATDAKRTTRVVHAHGNRAAWLLVGGTATLVTLGAIMAYAAHSSEADVSDLYVGVGGKPPVFDAATQQRYAQLLDEGTRYEHLAWTAFALAGATALAATITFAYGRGEDTTVQIAPTATPTSAGVSAALHF